MSVYVDATRVALRTTRADAGVVTATGAFRVCGQDPLGNPLNLAATVDELVVYGRALDVAEIEALYAQHAPSGADAGTRDAGAGDAGRPGAGPISPGPYTLGCGCASHAGGLGALGAVLLVGLFQRAARRRLLHHRRLQASVAGTLR